MKREYTIKISKTFKPSEPDHTWRWAIYAPSSGSEGWLLETRRALADGYAPTREEAITAAERTADDDDQHNVEYTYSPDRQQCVLLRGVVFNFVEDGFKREVRVTAIKDWDVTITEGVEREEQ